MNRVFSWAWDRALGGRPGVLTRVFWVWIPFNKPHRFRIKRLERGGAEVVAPDRRANRNHLGTQHACSLATVGEFAAGLALLGAFRPEDFRLIMSRLEVDYTRRAHGGIHAKAQLKPEVLASIEATLQTDGRVEHVVESDLSDAQGDVVATVRTHWQIKAWSQIQA